MKLPVIFTWVWFVSEASRRWPQSPPPPATGCWKEAVAWLSDHHHIAEARSLLRSGTGERAWALYASARYGLIEERGKALRALLAKAPGERAWALSSAARYGLIERDAQATGV